MVTVERDSVINMAVALLRAEQGFEVTLNKTLDGFVVSATFSGDEEALREAQRVVSEQRRKRGQV